ncbi:glycosyl transferase family 90-domain-containing protein [Nemania sp. FL0031]|nr:glycosyl transferase family 90-domain-containing protein [Nemania sp. FL0031]
MMPRNQPARVGRLWILLALCILLYLGLVARFQWAQSSPQRDSEPFIPTASLPSSDVYRLLNLSEQECKTTFPDLTKDLDATVALGPFTLKQTHGKGPLQARVKDGQLYIIHAEDKNTLSPELLQARQAALHQIHRALITSPTRLPNTIFSLNIRDQPYGAAWSYSRPAFAAPASAMPPITRTFLMPHFSFWSWPLPFIGSIARAAGAIAGIEEALPFARKDPRVVWRGSPRFNGVHYPTLRQDLLRETAGAKWADVQAIESYEMDAKGNRHDEGEGESEEWFRQAEGMRKEKGAERHNEKGLETAEGPEREVQNGQAASLDPNGNGNENGNTTTLMIEDFCRYKYVLYTDGVTYSGRLPFLQMCNSVLLTPPIAWQQATTHLVQPLFSHDLSLGDGLHSWTPSPGVRNAWPTHHGPGDANAVFVAPDWSDLRDTVAWLERHPEVAEGIARRQRDLFVGKGYLSPAMETCYWRALLRGWSSVVKVEGEGWEDEPGVSWETFSVDY